MGWDIEMVRLCRQGQQKKGGKETKQKRKKDSYGINSLVSSEVTLFFLSSPKTYAFFPIILLLKWAGGRSGWCRSPLLRFSMRVLSQRQMRCLLLMWINQMCHIWLIIQLPAKEQPSSKARPLVDADVVWEITSCSLVTSPEGFDHYATKRQKWHNNLGIGVRPNAGEQWACNLLIWSITVLHPCLLIVFSQPQLYQ